MNEFKSGSCQHRLNLLAFMMVFPVYGRNYFCMGYNVNQNFDKTHAKLKISLTLQASISECDGRVFGSVGVKEAKFF